MRRFRSLPDYVIAFVLFLILVAVWLAWLYWDNTRNVRLPPADW